MNYYSSDWHFNCANIINFERTQFKTIQEHDAFLYSRLAAQLSKMTSKDNFYFLGDFGDLSYLNIFNNCAANVYFILGNHDAASDINRIAYWVTEVFEYPIYLSQKLILSHFPQNVWPSQINIHGHLHGAKLNSANHLNASIHVTNYQLLNDKHINTIFSKIPKFNSRFLYEPYADMYQFIQNKEDVIMDKDGNIDLSASRVLQKLNAEKRKNEGSNYQPYTGGLN